MKDKSRKVLTTDTVAIVVGCGHHGQLRLNEGAKKLIEEKQLELHFFQTPGAVKEYNQICESRKTIAFVHVSC